MNDTWNGMINAKEVMKILMVGESKAYEIIRQLNEELTAKGFLTVRGKVPYKYLNERFFGADNGGESA